MNWKLSGAWAVVVAYGALFIWLLTLIPLWIWVVVGCVVSIPLSFWLLVWSWLYLESHYVRKP